MADNPFTIELVQQADYRFEARFERILAQFEDYCVVTQSVRAAIPVDVQVLDSQGTVLKS